MLAFIADDLREEAMGEFAAQGIVLLEELLWKWAEVDRLYPAE